MSSFQPFLNLSKYKSKEKEIYSKIFIFRYHRLYIPCFTDYACRAAGIIVLSEIIYCAVKWFKFTSEILIYVNLYLS